VDEPIIKISILPALLNLSDVTVSVGSWQNREFLTLFGDFDSCSGRMYLFFGVLETFSIEKYIIAEGWSG